MLEKTIFNLNGELYATTSISSSKIETNNIKCIGKIEITDSNTKTTTIEPDNITTPLLKTTGNIECEAHIGCGAITINNKMTIDNNGDITGVRDIIGARNITAKVVIEDSVSSKLF